ncbi:MAG: hypothetical protein IJ523_05120 [Succinivibrionaceae bacterium]|nr:hypothetical protein [Succinivibrionaceae bacterium]
MSHKFTPARIARLAVYLALIVASAYLITDRVTSPEKSDGKIPEFTAGCIRLRPVVVDENITDVNCSHENGVNRIFYSLSDSYRDEIAALFPISSAIISCEPEKVLRLIKRNEQITDEQIEAFFRERKFCTGDADFFAGHTQYSYVDKNNAPVLVIDIVVDEK